MIRRSFGMATALFLTLCFPMMGTAQAQQSNASPYTIQPSLPPGATMTKSSVRELPQQVANIVQLIAARCLQGSDPSRVTSIYKWTTNEAGAAAGPQYLIDFSPVANSQGLPNCAALGAPVCSKAEGCALLAYSKTSSGYLPSHMGTVLSWKAEPNGTTTATGSGQPLVLRMTYGAEACKDRGKSTTTCQEAAYWSQGRWRLAR